MSLTILSINGENNVNNYSYLHITYIYDRRVQEEEKIRNLLARSVVISSKIWNKF